MRILERYIAWAFVKNFVLGVLTLVTLYFSQALLSDLVDGDYKATQLIVYHLLEIPQIVVQMMPPAVLVATVLTLSGLNRTNELVACFSIGIGLARIVSIVLTLVFMICCLTLVLQDSILPPMYRKRTSYYWRQMKNRPDFFLDVRQDKIWYRSKNLIYNLRSFEPKAKRIIGMTVYTFDDDFSLLQVLDAESATYTPAGWQLARGRVTLFPQRNPSNLSRTTPITASPEALSETLDETLDDPFPITQSFASKSLVIPETPQDFQEIEKEVDSLRLKELSRFIGRMGEAGTDTKAYEVKLHGKISLSFIPLIMCILGVPFSGRNRREGGLAKDLGLCLLVTFLYWLLYSVGLSLGQNGTVAPIVAAWMPSVLFAALAGYLLYRQRRYG